MSSDEVDALRALHAEHEATELTLSALHAEHEATELTLSALRKILRARSRATAETRAELARLQEMEQHSSAAATKAISDLKYAKALLNERTAERNCAYTQIDKLKVDICHADRAADARARAHADAHAHSRAHAHADAHAHARAHAHAHDDAMARLEKDRLIAFKMAADEKKDESLDHAMSGGGGAAAAATATTTGDHCPVCTYVNTSAAPECEMCKVPLGWG